MRETHSYTVQNSWKSKLSQLPLADADTYVHFTLIANYKHVPVESNDIDQ